MTASLSPPDPSCRPCVVRMTPPGRGAVATLLVLGRGAVDVVGPLFCARDGRPLAEHPADRVVVGHFGPRGSVGEEMVARRISDEKIVLHCHGGTAAVARAEALLVDAGAAAKDWSAWAADSHDDPLQAEALVALAQATTERTAGHLLDQYQGALGRELDEIGDMLTSDGDANTATCRLNRLLARAPGGLHLTKPWKVVLAGRPNVGKSSLLNAMAGYTRAIVHAAPGTTRDVLTAATSIDGWPIELIDTAGLGEGGDPIETEGIRRAWDQIAAADLVLVVVDRSRPATDDLALLESVGQAVPDTTRDAIGRSVKHSVRHSLTYGACEHAPYKLVVYNKADLPSGRGNRLEGLLVSALTGEGVPELLRAVADRLVPDPPSPGEPIPWTRRQVEHLTAARAAVAAGRRAAAVELLARLRRP